VLHVARSRVAVGGTKIVDRMSCFIASVAVVKLTRFVHRSVCHRSSDVRMQLGKNINADETSSFVVSR
jgi:hypothetical protein